MQTTTEKSHVSKKQLWAGRIISGLAGLMILFASSVKLMKSQTMVQGFAQAGFPEHLVVTVGVIELLCAVIYLIPRTSVLGAILMTGLMGGATATNVRMGDPSMAVTIAIGILVWLGLFLRNERLRALIPLRQTMR